MSEASSDNRKRVGEILVDMGCLDVDELTEALGVQSHPRESRKLGEILVSRGLVKGHHVKVALAKQKNPDA